MVYWCYFSMKLKLDMDKDQRNIIMDQCFTFVPFTFFFKPLYFFIQLTNSFVINLTVLFS